MIKAAKTSTKVNDCMQDRVFMVILHVLLALILLVVVYPLLFVLLASVSDPQYVKMCIRDSSKAAGRTASGRRCLRLHAGYFLKKIPFFRMNRRFLTVIS